MASVENNYQDIHGRWHAPLMNAYNNYCWYITGLQRLQCSATLDELLRSKANIDGVSSRTQELITHILEPIRIVNKLNGTNGIAVVNELRNYFERNDDVYHSTDGFSTNIYLSKYVLPIIYNLSGNDNEKTKKIMEEIGMDSSSLYIANEVISDKRIPIMNASEEDDFRAQIYKPFHEKFIEYAKKNPFKPVKYASTDVQLWSVTNSGHIIPCIQTMNKKWIVFDDHRFVGDVKEYLSQPYNFHKVKFALTDSAFKSYMTGELNKMTGGGNAINNFEITETLSSFSLVNKGANRVATNPLTIAGGANKNNSINANSKAANFNDNGSIKIFYWLVAVVVILAVILIIIVRKISSYMRFHHALNGNEFMHNAYV